MTVQFTEKFDNLCARALYAAKWFHVHRSTFSGGLYEGSHFTRARCLCEFFRGRMGVRPEPIHGSGRLLEDAKKEGKVVVYVSSNASDAKALKAVFEKKYPLINMEFFSSGKDALLSKYLLEACTGTYLADVYQSSVFPIMNLLEKGLLAQYYSPEREAYIEALRDKDGHWNGMYLNALTMAYNTRLVKPDEVPTSY